MRRLLENIDALYTCDADHRVLRDAYLITDRGRIAVLGEGLAPDGAFDERIDLTGCVVTPGLVNVHHHFYQTLTRAIPGGLRGELIDWLRLMYPLWGGMTPVDLGAATASTANELLLTGATTSVDHAYCMPGGDPAYLEEEVAAAREAGIRLHLVRGSMTGIEGDLAEELSGMLGPRAGGIIDDPATVLAEMRRALHKHHETGFGSMLTVAPGPTVVTFDDLDFMRAVAALAREFDTGLHTHFHPRPDERALTAERFGRSPIEVMDDIGWLGPRTWFAHSTRMEPADMVLLGQRGVGVAHCPRMIMRLGVRITRVHDMIAQGVRVAVGVDGGASNDSGSMLGEMRLALLLHRLAQGGSSVPADQWLNPYDVLLMSTREAAAMIGRQDIGQLSSGYCADVTAFDMRGIGFAGARTDRLAGLLLAGNDTRAALTMVGGEVLVRNGQLTRADEQGLREAVDRATASLIDDAERRTGWDYRSFPASTLRGFTA